MLHASASHIGQITPQIFRVQAWGSSIFLILAYMLIKALDSQIAVCFLTIFSSPRLKQRPKWPLLTPKLRPLILAYSIQ